MLAALLDDEELSLDVVTRHPKVSGVIGTHAKRQAQQLRQQAEAEATQLRRRELASRGQYAELGQDAAGDYVSDPTTEATRHATQRLQGEAQSELAKLLEDLPKEAQQRLSDRAADGAYNGSFGEGLRTWVNDLAAERTAAELPKALDKEIKKRDLIPRAVAEAERVSGLGSPDVRRGGVAGAVDYETEHEMATALASQLAGLEGVESKREAMSQMTSWYRRHRR